MRQPELIQDGNKSIVFLDFSGLKNKEEIINQIAIFAKYIRSKPAKSLVTMTNLENMYFNTEIYNLFVKYVKDNNPYVKASAVVGLKGLMQIFYRGFIAITGRNVKVCNSKNEAIEALNDQLVEAV
ncbi:MAG TPA: hypothetical protein VJY41_09160 [Prolixibacteraceae bacterium]|nr:hypothetical protein [Prolixibacteraceae bacterium]